VHGCNIGITPFPEFLTKEIRPEINRIVRTLWLNEKRDALKASLKKLMREYRKHLNLDTYSALAVRNHVMYYIGRMPLERVRRILISADKCEKSLFVKLSIAFSLIKLGDYDKEEEFYQTIISDVEWDRSNRGYHLVYWGDWVADTYEPPYLDNGKYDWGRTFENLLGHIENSQPEYVMLRRIELFTMRRFVEERKARGRLNEDNLNRIRKVIYEDVYKNKTYKEKVFEEFAKLEKIVQNL